MRDGRRAHRLLAHCREHLQANWVAEWLCSRSKYRASCSVTGFIKPVTGFNKSLSFLRSALSAIVQKHDLGMISAAISMGRSRSDTRTPSLHSISLHADRYLRLHSGELTLSGSQMSVILETWTASVNPRPAKDSANEDHVTFRTTPHRMKRLFEQEKDCSNLTRTKRPRHLSSDQSKMCKFHVSKGMNSSSFKVERRNSAH